jgi:hypothetical protein
MVLANTEALANEAGENPGGGITCETVFSHENVIEWQYCGAQKTPKIRNLYWTCSGNFGSCTPGYDRTTQTCYGTTSGTSHRNVANCNFF